MAIEYVDEVKISMNENITVNVNVDASVNVKNVTKHVSKKVWTKLPSGLYGWRVAKKVKRRLGNCPGEIPPLSANFRELEHLVGQSTSAIERKLYAKRKYSGEVPVQIGCPSRKVKLG